MFDGLQKPGPGNMSRVSFREPCRFPIPFPMSFRIKLLLVDDSLLNNLKNRALATASGSAWEWSPWGTRVRDGAAA